MIPLKDINPTRNFPFVNVMLISANVLVFLYQLTLSPRAEKLFVMANATVPARFPAFLAGHAPASVAIFPCSAACFCTAG
jgi:membrane associated rhomboid family serine protease